jgi:hypothetical protein
MNLFPAIVEFGKLPNKKIPKPTGVRIQNSNK